MQAVALISARWTTATCLKAKFSVDAASRAKIFFFLESESVLIFYFSIVFAIHVFFFNSCGKWENILFMWPPTQRQPAFSIAPTLAAIVQKPSRAVYTTDFVAQGRPEVHCCPLSAFCLAGCGNRERRPQRLLGRTWWM